MIQEAYYEVWHQEDDDTSSGQRFELNQLAEAQNRKEQLNQVVVGSPYKLILTTRLELG